MMKNVIRRKKIFNGKLLELSVQKMRYPHGYIGNLEIVKHPGAVLIVPFAGRSKVVMLRQYRPVMNEYLYEVPAGTLNKGEKPLSCAKRELLEETGYTAQKWRDLGYIYAAPGYTTEKIHCFAAYGLKKVGTQSEEDELIYIKIMTIKHIEGLVRRGKIVDSKTLAALLLTRLRG